MSLNAAVMAGVLENMVLPGFGAVVLDKQM
jgi:hypothetical protein